MTLRLSDVTALLDGWYDPAWAEAWDAVGLVCGDPDQPVAPGAVRRRPGRRRWSTRPSLGRRPAGRATTRCCSPRCTASPPTTPKGRVVHRLVRAGHRAVHRAHQRRRRRPTGSTSRWPARVGLVDPQVVEAADRREPAGQARRCSSRTTHADAVRAALAAAGPGRSATTTRCTFTSPGEGRFRPLDGATPAIGPVGEVEVVDGGAGRDGAAARHAAAGVVAAMRAAHPYEEPAYDVVELADGARRRPPSRGHGRIGRLAEPTTLREFAEQVVGRAARRPRTACGSRATRTGGCETVVVGGGAGDFLLDTVLGTRRGRLPHLRPAAPPGRGVPRARRARRWSTWRTGRPSGPGCRSSRRKLRDAVAASGGYGGDPGERRSSPTRGPSGSTADPDPPRDIEENTLKADPFSQLKLLDVQELDSRLDQLRHRLAQPARARTSSPRSPPSATEVDGQARDAADRASTT